MELGTGYEQENGLEQTRKSVADVVKTLDAKGNYEAFNTAVHNMFGVFGIIPGEDTVYLKEDGRRLNNVYETWGSVDDRADIELHGKRLDNGSIEYANIYVKQLKIGNVDTGFRMVCPGACSMAPDTVNQINNKHYSGDFYRKFEKAAGIDDRTYVDNLDRRYYQEKIGPRSGKFNIFIAKGGKFWTIPVGEWSLKVIDMLQQRFITERHQGKLTEG